MGVKVTINELKEQLIILGVKNGDIIFIAADLLKLGYFNKDVNNTLNDIIKLLISLVGDEGTLVIPAYTEVFLRFRKNKKVCFSTKSLPTSGSLSIGFMSYPGVKRSQHPTNSVFAIGKYADFIIEGHDEYSSSYLPFRKIVELKGKNLMLACFLDSKKAPMAIHAAQESLGFTNSHWLIGMYQTYYYNLEGKLRLFTRWDIGGCTAGAHKMLGYHFFSEAIKVSATGNSYSALICTQKSFKIFYDVLKTNPKILRCDNLNCHHCYGTRIYNSTGFIYHWLKYIPKYIISKMC